jgi:uncharacterized protein (TIGR03382 family)
VDDQSCLPGLQPIAVATGPAQVTAGTVVSLDGSSSSDPDGTVAAYHWTQVAGPIANLSNVASPTPQFTAPSFVVPQVLTFQLIVSDDDSRVSPPDTVVIEVLPSAPMPDAAPVDAGPVADAAPAIDADPTAPDAASPPDAGQPGLDGGGGCCQTGSDGAIGGGSLAFAVLLGLRRRRRRE